MIIFDIDDTISPTQVARNWAEPHETKRVWGFNISIPLYVLDFLRSRDDIALLSTWDDAAAKVSAAFEFEAKILLIDEGGVGIAGKFDVVTKQSHVNAWIDDHMTPMMKKEMTNRGIIAIKPTGGVISKKQLKSLSGI
jgi:hypothetical protein